MSYTLKVKLPANASDELVQYYQNYSTTHVGDAGVDLMVPETITVNPNTSVSIDQYLPTSIDHKIQCEMIDANNNNISYYLYPRSSISNTPLIMANSVGIIDAGYRGNIIAKVRNMHVYSGYQVQAGTRLFQICAPDLKPITVQVVSELSSSSRGTGGFGSTNN